MTKIELELDAAVLAQAQTQAANQHTTVAQLVSDILTQKMQTPKPHSTLGLFADEPELMDRVMEMVQAERNKPLLEKGVDIE